MTSATNLDIKRILQDDPVSDDEKMKKYSTALTRYLSATKNSEMPWFASILGKLFKLSENVVVSNSPSEEQKITEERQISEDKIICNVPKQKITEERQISEDKIIWNVPNHIKLKRRN